MHTGYETLCAGRICTASGFDGIAGAGYPRRLNPSKIHTAGDFDASTGKKLYQ